MSAGPIPDLIAAARRLIEAVEYDVNGINGKGGNGGLTSDQTIRAAAELRVILSRLDTGGGVPEITRVAAHLFTLKSSSAARVLQGFLYGNRHCIRDLRKPAGEQVIWFLDTEDYDFGHSSMLRELTWLHLQEALREAVWAVLTLPPETAQP